VRFFFVRRRHRNPSDQWPLTMLAACFSRLSDSRFDQLLVSASTLNKPELAAKLSPTMALTCELS
jgi:hypothetical protein